MSESTDDAMILISISWQALKRAELGDWRTTLCDCIVIIIFASFFIEANLNKIIDLIKLLDSQVILQTYYAFNLEALEADGQKKRGQFSMNN